MRLFDKKQLSGTSIRLVVLQVDNNGYFCRIGRKYVFFSDIFIAHDVFSFSIEGNSPILHHHGALGVQIGTAQKMPFEQ